MSRTSEGHTFELHKYHVNHHTGFMLHDPLRTLPAYFEPWNELAATLPALMKEKKYRNAVDKLPLLDYKKLIGHRQLRLAHLQLSLITSGYVWQDGDKGVAQVLPKCVAVPYCKISEQLGVKPITCYVDLGLANWALIDPNGNIECLYHLPELRSGDWFCIVTLMMELSFSKCLKAVVRILNLLESCGCLDAVKSIHEKNAEAKIITCLREVSKATKDMKYALSRTRDHLDAKVFFNVIRPFLDGWGGENNPLPDGLIYEGISDIPVKLIGGSGAQSLSLQVLDALLGVEHKQDKRNFLLQMRSYMLPDHRRFVDDIEQYPHTLRKFVLSSTNQILKSSYNQCLEALADLRNYHLQLVKMYVLIPARKANEGKSESLDKRGTGGTNLIPFLKDICIATEDKRVANIEQVTTVSNNNWNYLIVTFGFLITAVTIAVVGICAKSII